jgi:integrative and conjugative element protein (TIGR02256 family)
MLSREMLSRCPTFNRPGGGRFQIGWDAAMVVGRYVQDEGHKPEAGGVLLGRHIHNSQDIVVDQVTTPMRGDYCSRTRYYRARQQHQDAINRAWRESGGTCTYLGEWHTHPEIMPAPSLIDQLTWRRKLMVDQFAGYLFFVIVGLDDVRVWEGRRRSPFVHSVRLIT